MPTPELRVIDRGLVRENTLEPLRDVYLLARHGADGGTEGWLHKINVPLSQVAQMTAWAASVALKVNEVDQRLWDNKPVPASPPAAEQGTLFGEVQ